jgi:hypothetical protein
MLWGQGTNPNGKHCTDWGREVDAGEVEASWPIRGEVKQMTPDTGWRRRKVFKYILDSAFSKGQL